MPWQQLAADLIGEHDGTGKLLHPLVVITVPRQSGKTALVGAVMLHRLMMRKQGRVWYTAQTGLKAREQLKELMESLELSKAGKLFICRRGNDLTSIELPHFRSRIVAHPPTGDSLHGNQSDLNVVDEGWFFGEDDAAALMGAIVPTQATRPNAQTLIISTAGTAHSTWFHDFVDRGHAGELPLIDYGVAPEVTDPLDFDAIAAAHPAISKHPDDGLSQKFDILPAAFSVMKKTPGEFLRAYGNRRTSTMERLIPIEVTELATTTDVLPAGGRPTFGCAVSFERDETVLVACKVDPSTGIPWVEVVATWQGTEGAGARCAEVTAKHGVEVLMDVSGPTATVADDAEREGGVVTRGNGSDLSAAVTDLLDRLRRPITFADRELAERMPTVRLRVHPAFSQALDVAVLRNSGDRVTLARKSAAGSVAALEAAALAIRQAIDPKQPTPPMIWS